MPQTVYQRCVPGRACRSSSATVSLQKFPPPTGPGFPQGGEIIGGGGIFGGQSGWGRFKGRFPWKRACQGGRAQKLNPLESPRGGEIFGGRNVCMDTVPRLFRGRVFCPVASTTLACHPCLVHPLPPRLSGRRNVPSDCKKQNTKMFTRGAPSTVLVLREKNVEDQRENH